MSERVLLISPHAPDSWGVGPIILRDTIAQFREGTFCLFLLQREPYDAGPECPRLETRQLAPPLIYRQSAGRGGGCRVLAQTLCALPASRRLADRALSFAMERGVSRVWLVLSRPVAALYGRHIVTDGRLPVHALVWDDPRHQMRQAGLDRVSQRVVMRAFATCLSRAHRVGVVSDAMVDRYGRDYGADCVIARHAAAPRGTARPQRLSPPPKTLRIGVAGGQYAQRTWAALISALDSMQWRIAGRSISVRVLGNNVSLRTLAPASVEMLGWRDTAAAADLLAECDLLYLPYPFDDTNRECAELSFPTKLGMYVSTGRPVFVHAPRYSSLARFFRQYPAGAVCTSLSPDAISSALGAILADPDAYERASAAAVRIADDELNRQTSREQFAHFLDLET